MKTFLYTAAFFLFAASFLLLVAPWGPVPIAAAFLGSLVCLSGGGVIGAIERQRNSFDELSRWIKAGQK